MVLLKLEKVTKRFGGLVAVNEVSLEIKHGDSIGIVGPNGSGKTTLFNLISGVYMPDEGRIFLEDQDITELPAFKRAPLGIARSFQIPRPFRSATVRENVAVGAMFGAHGEKMSVDEAMSIADHYIDLVGLGDKRLELADKLTAVEKKLLELARALAMKPKLLLLDEVVAGMNPNDVDKIVSLIKKIKEEEKIAAVAMVEHVIPAVMKFAERVMVMNEGKKMVEGATMEVLKMKEVAEVYFGTSQTIGESGDARG
jgi:branched-chain amino acid transport system ATP-binding protein